MKPLWDNLSALFIFLTLFVGELTVQAIYDPRATTTKPPKQRELIIVPWYLSGKDFQPPSDFSQSAKWNQSKDVKGPIVDRPEVKTDWSGQHKTPNFRTDDDQKNEKVDAGDNYESLEQRRDSEEIRGFTDDQNYPSQRLRISHGHRYNEEYESYENVENVRRKGLTEQPEKNIFDGERMENQDVYEDRTMFNKKPHKEKIAKVVTRPSSVVARYDSVLGVQCPYFEATGQFAHPLDCKFFVNCWNGRPFVQPCAPGTLFNPESLECDFPHKVKCYGGELSDLTAPNNLDALKRREDLSVTKTKGRYTTANLQTPECPAHVNGLLQHPTDCTKYLQCANGNTFIMDCGPGTVFNPAISVCDWPRNVYGCEGASKNNEEEVTTWNPPVFDHYDRTNIDVSSSPLDRIQQSAKKVKCPSDYTGLLPYPNNCKKFLQCANGVTHIMDCGPGTVFNPITTVCDWPYNVEGCDKDASKNNEGEVTTWIPPVFDHYDRTNVDVSSSPWDRIQQSAKNIKCPSDYTGLLPYPNDCKKFLQCANGVTYIMDCGPGTVFNPLTTVCDWPYNVEGCDKDETRPKQDIQPGTTAGTQWHENHHINAGNTQDSRESFSHHTDSYDHRHGHISSERQNVDKQHGWYDQREENGQSGQTYQGRDRQTYYDQLNSSKQQNNRHQTGFDNSQHGRHDVLYGTNNGNNRYEGHKEIQHQHAWQRERTDANSGYHYQQQNYHRQQQHHVGSVTGDENGYINGSDYQRFDNKTEDVTSDEPQTVVNENTRWRDHIYRGTVEMNGNTPNHHHHQHHHHHPYLHHTHGHNLNEFGGGEVPEGQNKQNGQGSENTDFPNKKFDYSRPDDNVYVDSNYQLPSESDSLNRESEYNKSLRFGQDGQFERNKTSRENWNQEEIPHTTRFGVFQPSTWGGRDQQSQGSEFEREGHTRHQVSGTNMPTSQTKLKEWKSRTNIHVPEIKNKDSDSKLDDRTTTKINVSNLTNVQVQTGIINETRVHDLKKNLYPNGIHANVNGIKGHYIIKVDQGHSNTRNQGHRVVNVPAVFNNKTYGSSYGHHKSIPVDGTSNAQSANDWKSLNLTGNNNDYRKTFNVNFTTEGNYLHNNSTTRRGINAIFNATVPDSYVPIIVNENHKNDREAKKDVRNATSSFVNVGEPDYTKEYQIDVLDDREIWKPTLVFENKTKKTNKTTMVMKIDKKKIEDIDIFDADLVNRKEELPFPVYYIPPVQQQLRPSYKSSPITPISGQVIRLRGGSSPRSGYLEVQGAKPGWGVVCDSRNSWTLKEAHVVCRQLGYTNGAEMSWQGRTDRENISDWIAANTVYCLGNETAFQSCKFTHGQKCLVERDAIGVQCLPNRVAHCRQDELPHQGQCYHLADSNSSLNHAEALNYCALRKARLLDIVDQAENNFVSEWLVQMHPEVRSIMTSGVGFTIWNRTVFLWEDFSRAKFRYAKWWPGWMEDKKLPPWVGVRPVCVVMKRNFPCHNRPDFTCSTDYFFWDIEDCSTSMKGHSYICKRPYDDIGCIYGKGQQYSGKVNVTSSGLECLPWNDDKVAHYLAVNVASEEIREGLKGHNYCRNPNPNKEWRPWCFTGPYAEREHCDIPSCGKLDTKKSIATGQCKPEHFKCRLGECIPSPWVCDGEKDCIDGADEEACSTHLNLFEKIEKHKLEGYDVEKWLNTPVKTCALRCKEADFTCRSFSHKAENNVCLLSDSNVGLSGALESNKDFNYYEMTERSVNCEKMFVCANRKCVNHAQVCDGKNDCNDHSDEKVCTANNLGYEIRLAGSNNSYEGRVEVKVLGKWGQVCDDGFGMANANVICKELGFDLGAVEIRPGGFYGNLDPPTRFLVDQLKCRGIETSLRECDFDGWGVHNCQPSEAVGIVCKTAVNNCQDGHWKCDNSPECIPMPFICDEVVDCVDGSDENPVHCDAPFELRLVNGSSPLEGRVEVRHHGVWGTVCDDDFSNAAAIVICRSLGYGGLAVAKKNGIFGSGAGPIWLDDVFCNGNESQLYRCEHNPWGQHNCGHDEDAGVICTLGEITEQSRESISTLPDISIDDILPTNCGQREEDFDDDDNEFLAKVVRGSIAPKGSYPWQASLRVRGHSKSNHWCGAVVLSTLHVLTAAHCLEGYNKGTYFVRAGDYNNEIDEGTEIEANIEDYYIHEDFRKGHRMNNDIALVLLKGRGIPLGRNVMPICLPPENAEYSPGLNCTISGWGSIESGTSIQSRDLRYGWVPLLDQSVCRANYVYGNGAISDGMVCAGYLDEGADSCDGDSGGPLACYHNGAFTLYGVTSWGHHCGRTNKPGVYVRIAYYRQWIDRMLRESLAGR